MPWTQLAQEVSPINLKESSYHNVDDEEDSCDDIEAGFGGSSTLIIVDGEKKLSVSACCAICLDEYAVEDAVVWSSNEDCPHVFHQNCIVEYLAKVKNIELSCPCCRQTYCELADAEKEVLILLNETL